jgi:hypothetical protein
MRLRLLLFIVMASTGGFSETIPALRGTSFADAKVELPGDLHGRAGILILGFSKKSSEQTKMWSDALMLDYGNNPRFVYYEAAVLGDAPALVRGTVVKWIRGGMAPAERAHFVPILEDAAKWREAVHYAAADEAYVLVINDTGEIECREHGAPTSEVYGRMKGCLVKVAGGR